MILRALVAAAACAACAALAAAPYDLVIANGRVMDPESNLDAVLNVGIRAGRIEAVTADLLEATETIDASGMVVAPGFIDLHWHGKDPRSSTYEAMDGVTSTFNCCSTAGTEMLFDPW